MSDQGDKYSPSDVDMMDDSAGGYLSPELTWSEFAQPRDSPPWPFIVDDDDELDDVMEPVVEDDELDDAMEPVESDGEEMEMSDGESTADEVMEEKQAGGRKRSDKEEKSPTPAVDTVELSVPDDNHNHHHHAVPAADSDPDVDDDDIYDEERKEEEKAKKDKAAKFRFKSKYLYAVHAGVIGQFIKAYQKENPGKEIDPATFEEICETVTENYGRANTFGARYLEHIEEHGPEPEFMAVVKQLHSNSALYHNFGVEDLHFHSLAKLLEIYHTTNQSIVNVDDNVIGHILFYDRHVECYFLCIYFDFRQCIFCIICILLLHFP